MHIAWSVVRTRIDTGFVLDTTRDPLMFTDLLANEGEGWNMTVHKFCAPEAGLYYVTMTAGFYTFDATMKLVVSGSVVASIARLEKATEVVFREYTISKSVLVRLSQDTVLYARSPVHDRQHNNVR
jgi:hypothetical protein